MLSGSCFLVCKTGTRRSREFRVAGEWYHLLCDAVSSVIHPRWLRLWSPPSAPQIVGAAYLLATLIRHGTYNIDICDSSVVNMSVCKLKVLNDDFHVLQIYTSRNLTLVEGWRRRLKHWATAATFRVRSPIALITIFYPHWGFSMLFPQL
jgi:hypothetical protein